MRFMEGFFEPISMSKYLETIRWPDVIGMNVASSYGAISYAVAINQIKRVNPKAFIMLGGHHANMFTRRWLELGADLVVRGEAELTFTGLVDEIAGERRFESVPGVAFLRDGEYVETNAPPQIETLDESPMPDLDLINFEVFPCMIDSGGGYTGSVETSRGCMFRCKFCAVPPYWKGTQRFKSVPRVMEEIRELVKRDVRQINILDDGFGNNVELTEELVEAFTDYDRMPAWNAFLRVDTVVERPELIDRLARSGMKSTLLGFESINPDVLRDCMGKGMKVQPTLEQLQQMYQRFKKNDVLVIGVFISGHPEIGDERETRYRDARTICDDPRLADYMPYPGTMGFDELSASHQLKDMFFHDVKMPIFPDQKTNAFIFNFLNIIDLPRSLRMALGPYQHRNYLFWSHRQLWSKAMRVNRTKLRDFMLMRKKNLSSDQMQEQLFKWYLEDPGYGRWLDALTGKKWF